MAIALGALGLLFASAPAMAAKPQIQLEQSNYNVLEGGQATIRAVANAKVTGNVTIQLATGTATASGGCPAYPPGSPNGSDDFNKLQSPLTVSFNNSKTSTLATSDTCNDQVNEGNETYKATIDTLSGFGTTGASVGGKKSATVTILDNDPMVLNLNTVSVDEGQPAVLAVTSQGGTVSQYSHTVNFTTADGGVGVGVAGDDYTAKTSSVTIPPFTAGSVNLPSITTINDGAWSPPEFFNVNVTGVTGPNASAGSNGTVNLNEVTSQPYFTIDDASAWEGTPPGSGNNVDFLVTKHGSSEVSSSLSYQTASAGLPPGHATGGTSCDPTIDYLSQSSPPPVTFGPGGDATAHILVPTCPDTDVEPNETFNLTTTGTVNGTAPSSAATGTIKDDEPFAMTISDLGSGSGTDNNADPVTANVQNKSGDALSGVMVRFELFRDIGTPDNVFQAIDLGQNGGAGYANTNSLGNATITDSGPSAGNGLDRIVGCVVSSASTDAAVCTSVNDPSASDPLNPTYAELYDGNEDVTVYGLKSGLVGSTHDISFTP